jgi:septal ring factor EnvC (AmiA/AmiB activator)
MTPEQLTKAAEAAADAWANSDEDNLPEVIAAVAQKYAEALAKAVSAAERRKCDAIRAEMRKQIETWEAATLATGKELAEATSELAAVREAAMELRRERDAARAMVATVREHMELDRGHFRERRDWYREVVVRLERIRVRSAQMLASIEQTTAPDAIAVLQAEHSKLCRERRDLLKAAGVEGRLP